jgi:hypothetical protein
MIIIREQASEAGKKYKGPYCWDRKWSWVEAIKNIDPR